MTRQRPGLRPPTPERAARIPETPLRSLTLSRATWTEHAGMWWFSNRSDEPHEAGRFDLERPHGTCYFATDPVAALVEKLTDPDDEEPLTSTAVLERITVWTGRVEHGGTVADTTRRAARVSKELGTITPYELPWAWADALHAVGRAGLVAWLRSDSADSRTVAVFGPASEPDRRPDPAEWPDFDDRSPASAHADGLAAALDILEEVPTLEDLEEAVEPDPPDV